jgi:regulator of replication initiation timing
MKTNMKVGALMVVLLLIATLFMWQEQQIKRLRAEAAALCQQLEPAASLRDENQHLADRLKAAADGSQAGRSELMRLRAQASRLRQVEQENAQLKIERQHLASRIAQSQAVVSTSEPQSTGPASGPIVIPPPANVTDLGMIEISDRAPTQFDLGAGQNCVVTPTVLSDGNIQMEIAVEVKTDDGKVEQLGQSRLTARPGQQCAISVGDMMISLTAKLKTE